MATHRSQDEVPSLDGFPNEIKSQLLIYFDIDVVSCTLKRLSKSWNRLCNHEVSSRLMRARMALLHAMAQRPTIFDATTTRRKSHIELLLVNFDGETTQAAMSCVDLECVGFDIASTSIIFHPTGTLTSLGLWIHRVGFIPIVPPEISNQAIVSFANDHPPWLYLTYSVERSSPIPQLQIREEEAKALHQLPKAERSLSTELGADNLFLIKEKHGRIAIVKYRIGSKEPAFPKTDNPSSENEEESTSNGDTFDPKYPDIITGSIESVKVRASYFFRSL